MSGRVYFEIANAQRFGLTDGTAAQQGSHALQQLGKRKRFYQVIIRSLMQSSDSVLDGITRRQEQDGSFFAAAAQLGKHRPPVFAREHDVEDNQIVIAGSGKLEASRAVFGDVHDKTALGEAFPDISGRLVLILYYQDSHEAIIPFSPSTILCFESCPAQGLLSWRN